ncbi:hypothetical protein PO124_21555 [Bacillus licheniformis]|nr:hypothetical protein [Bacillus licheniformis]
MQTAFYGFYIDFITIPVLFQAKTSGAWKQFQELFNPVSSRFPGPGSHGLAGKTRERTGKSFPLKPLRSTMRQPPERCCLISPCRSWISRSFKLLLRQGSACKNIGLYQFHLLDGISQTFNLTQKRSLMKTAWQRSKLHKCRLQQTEPRYVRNCQRTKRHLCNA